MNILNKKRSGFVSIFVVIFAAILIAIITISFIRLMIKDQQQATNDDLSRSAYDSAQAGVEDAKVALLRYINACNSGDTATCAKLQSAIDSGQCNLFINGSTSEVQVETGQSNNLEQSYTCVKAALNTQNYLGSLKGDQSKIIPLSSTSGYDTIEIDWFNSNNIASSTSVNLSSATIGTPLLKVWGTSLTTTGASVASSYMPPIMRAEIIQYDKINGFVSSDFDNSISSGNGSNTLFLYPVRGSTTSPTTVSATSDVRRLPTRKPVQIYCSNTLTTTTYACKARISLPSVVDSNNSAVYLNLTALYNKTDYQVVLLNSADATKTVYFRAVQPEIDSTGRANDLFKRVKTRIELSDVNFPYPESAIDVTNGFCKDFSITDNINDYNKLSSDSNTGRCAD